jgi:hypothetical protein
LDVPILGKGALRQVGGMGHPIIEMLGAASYVAG